MENKLLELAGVIVGGVVATALFIYYRSRILDNKIEMFYKKVDTIRNNIHNSSSMIEVREAHEDINNIRESFDGHISKLILDKEVSLLLSLNNKKIKKIR